MWFAQRDALVGVVVLVVAFLIFRSAKGNRTVAVLCVILGLVGVCMLLVRGLGLL